MLHTCWCIVFGCFEFKFVFEFICLLLFKKNQQNPFLFLSPFYSFLVCFPFWPKPPKSCGTPSISLSRLPLTRAARACSRSGRSPAEQTAQLRPARAYARPLSPTGGTHSSSPTSRRLQPGLRAAARLRLGYDLLGVARTPRCPPDPFISRPPLPYPRSPAVQATAPRRPNPSRAPPPLFRRLAATPLTRNLI
jgi:hypothetical protein